MKHARIMNILGAEVLQFVDTVEDSEGETVWAITTRWITPNEGVVSLQTIYGPEAELKDVVDLMHNRDAHKEIAHIMESTLVGML